MLARAPVVKPPSSGRVAPPTGAPGGTGEPGVTMLLLLLLGCGPDRDAPPAPSGRVVDGARLTAWTADGRRVELTGRAVADGPVTVTLTLEGDTVRPTLAAETDAVVTAVLLEGTVTLPGEAPVRLWRQGYQSWSWSGVVEPEAPASVDGVPTVGGDDGLYGPVAETAGTSWWAGLLGRTDAGAVHLGQADRGGDRHLKTWLATDGTALTFGWGGRGEAVAVPAGTAVRLDGLAVSFPDEAARGWEDWADRVAAPLGARVTGAPPLGWSDWYQYYGEADEAALLANLAAAADLGLGLFQVDDGWEVAWGDWTANPSFPSGTAGLAAAIDAAGLTPGLWMAPLHVDRATATWADHPDWWLRDAAGEEVTDGPCDCAVLDVTHPDAAAWMEDRVRERVAEGWRYLKLDFLYAGAMEGRRQADVTGVEAYAEAVRRLRAAAGPDTTVLACGAPMLPSVGFADAWRSGADIAFAPTPDPEPAFLRWQARATAARAFANGRWWWNDPDNLLLRDPFGAVEVRGAIAAQAASGGSWLLGDDLLALDPERLALATRGDLVALRGQRARPVDPLAFPGGVDGSPAIERALPDDLVPHRFELADGTVVLLNLGETPVEVDGPGGEERLTGATAGPGPRTIAPGDGEVWTPAD